MLLKVTAKAILFGDYPKAMAGRYSDFPVENPRFSVAYYNWTCCHCQLSIDLSLDLNLRCPVVSCQHERCSNCVLDPAYSFSREKPENS